jgi:hypothetical protein
MEDLFADTPFGKVALAKLKPTDPNFRLFFAGWLGDYETTDTMEVKGAVFREAKSGPRKGQPVILVRGTERTAYVTEAEMRAVEVPA